MFSSSGATLMAPSASAAAAAAVASANTSKQVEAGPRSAQSPLVNSAPTPIRPNALIIFSAQAGGGGGGGAPAMRTTRTMGPQVCRSQNYTNSNANCARRLTSPLVQTPLGAAGEQSFFRCSTANSTQAPTAPPTPTTTTTRSSSSLSSSSSSSSSASSAITRQQQHYQHQHQHQHQHQQPKALSPSGGLNDSLPSQILPNLFVGNLEQTNRETVNKLNIKYILSLGLLPVVLSNNNCCLTSASSSSSSSSPSSPNKTTTTTTTTSTSNNNIGSSISKVITPTSTTASATSQSQQQQQILMPTQDSSVDFKIRIRSNTPTPSTTPLAEQAGGTKPMLDDDDDDDENRGIKQVRSIHCKCINISDNSDQMLIKFFDEAYAFIDEARRKKCNILIHCLAGISRSPTIAVAYLMRIKSLHWKDAYDMVKRCRPQIDPNLNFMAQLRIYNKSLRDETKKLKLTPNKRLQL